MIVPACLFVVALCLGLCSAPCDAGSVEGNGAQPDSLRQPRTSFVILPYAYYTPETKVAFGAGSIYSFRTGGAPGTGAADSAGTFPDGRPSSVRAATIYTQLSQIILALMPEIYLQKERYYYTGFYGYYKYPDKFWGIGGDTPDGAEENYRKNDFESNTSLQRRSAPGIYAGALFQYRYMNVDDADSRGALQAGGILPSMLRRRFRKSHRERLHIQRAEPRPADVSQPVRLARARAPDL